MNQAIVHMVPPSDGSGKRYESILEMEGYRFSVLPSMREALEAFAACSMDLLLLEQKHEDQVRELQSKSMLGANDLMPDVLFLKPVGQGLSEGKVKGDPLVEALPFDFLLDRTRSVESGPSIHTIPHPAEPEEFLSALHHILQSRRLRLDHLHAQRHRSLYKRCVDLTWLRSPAARMRVGLETAMASVGAQGGAVVRLHPPSPPEMKVVLGQEVRWMSRVVLAVLRWQEPSMDEWQWFQIPALVARSQGRVQEEHGLLIPFWHKDDQELMLALLLGPRKSLPLDMKADLDLVIAHLKLGFDRLAQREMSGDDPWRDPWTGLLNLEQILIKIDEMLSKRALDPLSLLVLDIDGFRKINDERGHLAGGGVLQEITRRLLPLLSFDYRAGRMEPDRFLVVMPGRNKDEAARRARSIIEEIEISPIPIVNSQDFIRVKILSGVAEAASSSNAQTLLKKALEDLARS